ncbi:MAG: site-2 protease family protein [Clostridia bacterium]|nr:site-2 protease family protein [Clostridia bacterium]
MLGLFSVESLMAMLLSVPGVIFAFTMKGFGQALVSKWLGDPTPEDNGRLTMNPLAHIDWIGLVCMAVFGFGWTKPMPTNSRYYKNYKRDTVLYSLSGSMTLVLVSFIMAFFHVLFLNLTYRAAETVVGNVFYYITLIFYYAQRYPLILALFYLLPLPGLDGYKIITTFTPYKWNTFLYKVERYSMFIFLGFILLMRFTVIGDYIFYPAIKLSELFDLFWQMPLGFISGSTLTGAL